MFTRQHFIKVAEIISDISDNGIREEVAERFVTMFYEDNPRFDVEKFRKACNVRAGVDE